jgi:5'-deoxynucleotidase YfbR-like HD superfamily hydrolase
MDSLPHIMHRQDHESDRTHVLTARSFFDLNDADPEAIHIDDIARSLSRIPRYLGHTDRIYTVAQHSVLVALKLPEALRFVGLMHDAPEAYTGDIVYAVKHMLGPAIREIENPVWAAIALRYDLPIEIPAEVHEVDRRMAATEMRDLFTPSRTPRSCAEHKPYSETIEPWSERTARANFLHVYRQFVKRSRDWNNKG